MDTVSPETRSRIMSSIRGRDTKPEMAVRRYLHAAGLRYRLHASKLPGKPDLVFPSRRLALFVHGCFWHGCSRCRDGAKTVKSNTDYWHPKLKRIRERDRRNRKALQDAGWQVRVMWECEARNADNLDSLAADIKATPKAARAEPNTRSGVH